MSDLEAKAREIAGLLKGDVAPNFRDQFVQRCQDLALHALREERERAVDAVGEHWRKTPSHELSFSVIAAAIRGDSNGC